MRSRTVGVALVGVAVIAGVSAVAAQKGRPRLTEVPGQTTIACQDDLSRADSPGDGVCGDLQGPYFDDVNGVESSLRDGDREFRLQHLNTVFPAIRHLTLRFPAVAAPSQSFECVGTCAAAGRVLNQVIATTVVPGAQNAGANTNLVTAGNVEVSGGLTSILPGASHAARFLIGFPDPDGRPYRWGLYFNPAVYPNTGLATVTRTAACTWTITAGPDDLAGLTLFSQGKGKTVQTFEGRFSMPFTMTFTAPACVP